MSEIKIFFIIRKYTSCCLVGWAGVISSALKIAPPRCLRLDLGNSFG